MQQRQRQATDRSSARAQPPDQRRTPRNLTRPIDPELIRIPGYRPTHALPDSAIAPRLLATRRDSADRVVLHPLTRSFKRGLSTLHSSRTSRDAKRFLQRIGPLRNHAIPHTLPILDTVPDAAGWHWVVTPYLGSADGLLSLDHLLAIKELRADHDHAHEPPIDSIPPDAEAGEEPLRLATHEEHTPPPPRGQLALTETEHATRHLLTASRRAHDLGIAHGTVHPHEVLVDKHGSLAVELYAAKQLLDTDNPPTFEAAAHEELRSIARIAYTALTGTLDVPDPYIDASRLDQRITKAWDRWLDYALDPSRGFASAQQALEHLPPSAAPLPGDATRREHEQDGDRHPTGQARRAAFAGFRPWRTRST